MFDKIQLLTPKSNRTLPMTNCIQESFVFPGCKGRRIEASFEGGDITSDGGVLLLRQVDRVLKLSESINKALDDPRRRASCQHDGLSLVRQRLYAWALGYEDLNDHHTLRGDLALQTAVECTETLASASTLCRFENRADGGQAWRLHEVLLKGFIGSFKRAPRKLVLDFDATDDHYCFLPLYVFCRDQLLVSYLRPSKIDGAKHAWAILLLLVKRLRQRWPKVRIVLRADSGFCRWRILSWCERHAVEYIVGIARFERTATKQRVFDEFTYAAATWNRHRRIIVKGEHTAKGANPRYIVTNLSGAPKRLYDQVYCARGEMENRIKEQQLDLFADRTSCHRWWPNQFRLLMSSFAYVLLETIRRLGLADTELSRAYVGTIRLKLLNIGAVILRNTRRIRFLLASAHPYQMLYFLVAHRLAPG